ncbi:MAG: adenylosuccinate synthase [Deltaproteobacteria bacterium]|nr:adenylosuccinate synthase [Deltaproteobacteria bacterium]
MSNVVIVGTQWGDEGKGKIVDLYAREADVIVRFQGGNNAGHTLVVGGVQTILHLIPSGILHEGKTCILGNGMVINPEVLLQEIDELHEKDLFPSTTELHISENAHMIMPYHRRIDSAREGRRGGRKIGTTGRGIGPAYEDKIARTGIRFGQFIDENTFRELLLKNMEEKNFLLTRFFEEEPLDAEAVFEEYRRYALRLRPYAADTSLIIRREIDRGRHVLFEGAQGCHLDIDHGTYPYVTSSNTVAGNACCGAGLGPTDIDTVIGICKAYTTRVGKGPFVTELDDAVGERLQSIGKEFGATTGRKRRCGWLDAVLVRQAVRLSGITALAVTKLDVLTGIDPLKVCVGYEVDGDRYEEHVPSSSDVIERCTPIYEEIEGWSENISGARRKEDLPRNTRRYIERIEELAGVRAVLISVGPGREDTIIVESPF